jgi:tRNA/rRNA methyltransferase
MKPSIILVSPKGEENVGGVARLMGNFGLHDLRIVSPRCDLNADACKKRSLKAYSIIERAKLFGTLSEALGDVHFAAAFSMRPQSVSVPSVTLSDFFSARWLEVQSAKSALVFGREDNGLEAEELLKCNEVIWIPTTDEFPSINLTSAVAMALHSWFSNDQKVFLQQRGHLQFPPKKDEEVFFHSLRELLEEIEFMKSDSDHILDDLQNMYRRASISDRDLRILFGIISDIGRHLKKQIISKP